MADESNGTMTTDEKKILMRSLWEALLKPKWTKDDLIDFGKAIFTKKRLKEMDDKTFNKVFPFLTEVVEELGARLQLAAEEEFAARAETGPEAEAEPKAEPEKVEAEDEQEKKAEEATP